MRFNRVVLAALVCSVSFLLPFSVLAAPCSPNTTTEVSCLKAADKSCIQLGETTLDKDHKNVIACLRNEVGGLEWKASQVNLTKTNCEWIVPPNAYTSGKPIEKFAICPDGKYMAGVSFWMINKHVDDEHVRALCCSM